MQNLQSEITHLHFLWVWVCLCICVCICIYTSGHACLALSLRLILETESVSQLHLDCQPESLSNSPVSTLSSMLGLHARFSWRCWRFRLGWSKCCYPLNHLPSPLSSLPGTPWGSHYAKLGEPVLFVPLIPELMFLGSWWKRSNPKDFMMLIITRVCQGPASEPMFLVDYLLKFQNNTPR